MTALRFSETEYLLLHRVHDHLVVLHDSTEPTPGWSWTDSHMPPEFQGLCDDARRSGHIDLGVHQPWGSPAFLSQSGVERLTELYRLHMSALGGVTA